MEMCQAAPQHNRNQQRETQHSIRPNVEDGNPATERLNNKNHDTVAIEKQALDDKRWKDTRAHPRFHRALRQSPRLCHDRRDLETTKKLWRTQEGHDWEKQSTLRNSHPHPQEMDQLKPKKYHTEDQEVHATSHLSSLPTRQSWHEQVRQTGHCGCVRGALRGAPHLNDEDIRPIGQSQPTPQQPITPFTMQEHTRGVNTPPERSEKKIAAKMEGYDDQSNIPERRSIVTVQLPTHVRSTFCTCSSASSSSNVHNKHRRHRVC